MPCGNSFAIENIGKNLVVYRKKGNFAASK